MRGAALPAGIDVALFDYAVNSGPGRAARVLQEVLGVAIDGAIGPRTLGAAHACAPEAAIRAIGARRLALLERLDGFAVFGRGWRARVARTEAAALACLAA
mgnify:FL=1